MALSMEEQRLLTEIASRLSADDPRLAARLAAFGRSRRRRIFLMAAIVVAAVVTAAGVAAAIAAAVV